MSDGRPTLLLVCGYGGPYRGSFVPMLREMARQARVRGWDVACSFTPVARDRPWLADLVEDGIPFDFAPSSDRRELGPWLEQRVDGLPGPVIIHSHFTSFDLPAAGLAADPGTAAIWHVHTFLPSHPVRVLAATLKYGWVARRVSRVVCVSAGTAKAIGRRGGGGRTAVIENGIDSARFHPPDEDERRRAREALGLPAEAQVLLHFAWDWEVKGGPLFCELLARLRASGSDALGVTVGGGEHAVAAAERLGLGEALRAAEPSDEVDRFYAAADALCATSAAEGAPFAMLEALSCGTAIVATDIPGHRLDRATPAALRLAPADPQSLAGLAAATLDREPAKRRREALEAHEWVRANRGLEGWGERIGAVYDAALDELRS